MGGGGIFAAGEGVDRAANGTAKIIGASALAFGAYLYFKK